MIESKVRFRYLVGILQYEWRVYNVFRVRYYWEESFALCRNLS